LDFSIIDAGTEVLLVLVEVVEVVEIDALLFEFPLLDKSLLLLSNLTMLTSCVGLWFALHAKNFCQYGSRSTSRFIQDLGPRLWIAA